MADTWESRDLPVLKAAVELYEESIFVGEPTGEALRVAGQWPSPEVQLQKLIAAFEAVAADDSRPEEERSRAKVCGSPAHCLRSPSGRSAARAAT